MRRLATTALLVGLLLPAGCGGGPADREADGLDPVALPVDVRAALASSEDRAAPLRAEQLLIQRCMRGRGQAYLLPSDDDARSSERWYRLEDVFQFGPPPRTEEEDYGLAARRGAFEESVTDPNAEVLDRGSASARAAWDDALNGSGEHLVEFVDPATGTGYAASTDGCRTKAQVQLYGSFGNYMELGTYSGRFADAVQAQVAADPVYESARAAWAACARERGFDMEHPSEPFGQAVVAVEGGVDAGAAELERRNHELGVACEATAHVYDLGWRRTEELLPEVLHEEAGLVEQYRQVIRRARDVLAGADP